MIEEAEEESSSSWFRKFGLVELTEKQHETEKYWNNRFCEYVGTHYNFTNGTRNSTEPLKQSLWPLFYDKYKAEYQKDFNENSVLGWFED